MIWLLLLSCIPQGSIKQPFHMVPEERADGWEVSTPEAEGLDPERIEAAYRALFEDDHFPSVRSLLIVANGKLVAEAYFREDADRDRLQHVQSITKTWTSLICGIAIDQGHIPDVERSIAAWLDVPDEHDKRDITIEHLLTMTSGLDISNTRFGIQVLMRGQDDSVAWVLDQPMYDAPGGRWYYRDADPHLVGAVVSAATGQPFEDYADANLMAPLGIERWRFEDSPDGVDIAAAGIWLTPRDLMRMPVMVLDGGQWDGRQVVSEAWLTRSTAETTAASHEELHVEAWGYGYYWWTFPEMGAYTAAGHGGQIAAVVPWANAAVVLTADPYASGEVAMELQDHIDLLRDLFGDPPP